MKFKKIIIILTLSLIFGLIAFSAHLSPRYTLPILKYHHIDGEGDNSSLSVSPENFQRQMSFLSRRHYNVISLAKFVQAKVNQEKLPRNTVVITFDDGYEDNYTFAYPVLKRHNLPATIFVVVDSIGQEGFLSYTQIKEMTASGNIDIGSHTLSHSYLPSQSARKLEREIGDSKRILEKGLNKKVELFCYPLGHFSPQVQAVVQSYGYKAACTTNRGKVQTYTNDDLFALKRIKVKDNFANLFTFWVKVSGYYNVFRTVRPPY